MNSAPLGKISTMFIQLRQVNFFGGILDNNTPQSFYVFCSPFGRSDFPLIAGTVPYLHVVDLDSSRLGVFLTCMRGKIPTFRVQHCSKDHLCCVWNKFAFQCSDILSGALAWRDIPIAGLWISNFEVVNFDHLFSLSFESQLNQAADGFRA